MAFFSSSWKPSPIRERRSRSAAISSKYCRSPTTPSKPSACSRRRIDRRKLGGARECGGERLADPAGDAHLKSGKCLARRVVLGHERLREALLVRLAQPLLAVGH